MASTSSHGGFAKTKVSALDQGELRSDSGVQSGVAAGGPWRLGSRLTQRCGASGEGQRSRCFRRPWPSCGPSAMPWTPRDT